MNFYGATYTSVYINKLGFVSCARERERRRAGGLGRVSVEHLMGHALLSARRES